MCFVKQFGGEFRVAEDTVADGKQRVAALSGKRDERLIVVLSLQDLARVWVS
jgi:hypothetical protein